MKKEQNLTSAGVILLVSSVIVKLIGALFKIPLSSDYALGDLGFGYFSAAYDMYLPLYNIALTGFPVAIARIVADFTAQKREAEAQKSFIISLKALVLLGIIGAFCLCAFSIPLISLTDKSGNSLLSLYIIAPAVFFCCISAVFRGYFEGLKNMVPMAVSNILEALCKLILGLSGAIIVMRLTNDPTLGAAAAMIGITIGSFLSSLYLFITFKKEKLKLRLKGVWDNSIFKAIAIMAIPVAIASLNVSFTSLIDAVTLRFSINKLLTENPQNAALLLEGTRYDNINPSEISTLLYGIRGKAHTLFNLVPTLTAAFGMGSIPIITENHTLSNSAKLKKNCNLTVKLSSLITLPIALGMFSLSEEITALLFGELSAMLGGKLLKYFAIAALFAGFSIPLTSLLQAVNRQKQALVNIVLGLLVKTICNIALARVESINILASGIGTAICFGLIFSLNIISLKKALGFGFDFVDCFLKPLLSALGSILAAILVNFLLKGSIGTVLAIILAGIVYIVFLWFLKAVTPQDIEEFKKQG